MERLRSDCQRKHLLTQARRSQQPVHLIFLAPPGASRSGFQRPSCRSPPPSPRYVLYTNGSVATLQHHPAPHNTSEELEAKARQVNSEGLEKLSVLDSTVNVAQQALIMLRTWMTRIQEKRRRLHCFALDNAQPVCRHSPLHAGPPPRLAAASATPSLTVPLSHLLLSSVTPPPNRSISRYHLL